MKEVWPGIGLLLKSTDCIAEQMKVIKWQQRRIKTLTKLLDDHLPPASEVRQWLK